MTNVGTTLRKFCLIELGSIGMQGNIDAHLWKVAPLYPCGTPFSLIARSTCEPIHLHGHHNEYPPVLPSAELSEVLGRPTIKAIVQLELFRRTEIAKPEISASHAPLS